MNRAAYDLAAVAWHPSRHTDALAAAHEAGTIDLGTGRRPLLELCDALEREHRFDLHEPAEDPDEIGRAPCRATPVAPTVESVCRLCAIRHRHDDVRRAARGGFLRGLWGGAVALALGVWLWSGPVDARELPAGFSLIGADVEPCALAAAVDVGALDARLWRYGPGGYTTSDARTGLPSGEGGWVRAARAVTLGPCSDAPAVPTAGALLPLVPFDAGTGGALAPGVVAERLDTTHQYSRRAVWNADESLRYTGADVVDPDGRVVATAPFSTESTWSALDPDVILGLAYVDGRRTRLVRWTISTDRAETLADFAEFDDVTMGRWEGVPSHDDARVLLVGKLGGRYTLVAYDLERGSEIARTDAPPGFDWAGFSPSGRWIVANGDVDGEKRLIRYRPDLTEPTTIDTRAQHGDFCTDATGSEVYAQVGYPIRWIRLDDGVVTELDINGHGHLSCRSMGRPGWAYLSLDGGAVGALELAAGTTRWERWGEHGSSGATYAAQPKVSVSPSGRQLVVASDADGPVSDVLMRLDDGGVR